MEICNMSSDMMLLSKVVAVMLLALALSGSAYAGCSGCAGGSGGEWSSGPSFAGISAEAVSVMDKNSEPETTEMKEPEAPSLEITPEESDDFVYETFAFWVMKYLGHEEVFILDGTREDREAAGLLFVASPSPRAAEIYIQDPNLDLLAGDDDLAGAQLVDARSAADYDAGHMEGAVNIDASTLMGSDGRLADDEALSSAFSGLAEGLPVVIYSSKGGQASIVWYALYTQGRQASLYPLGSQA